jgi:hypothetical protein
MVRITLAVLMCHSSTQTKIRRETFHRGRRQVSRRWQLFVLDAALYTHELDFELIGTVDDDVCEGNETR